MAYKVIIMPPAKRRLDMYVYYTYGNLKEQTGGKVNSCRCERNKKRLSVIADSIKICDDPLLAQYGYRKIRFVKHKFVMIYRIESTQVIVDGIFHELQDYEGIFARGLHLGESGEAE